MSIRAKLYTLLMATIAMYPPVGSAQQRSAAANFCVRRTFPTGVTTLEQLKKAQSPSLRRQTLESYLNCLRTTRGVPAKRLEEMLRSQGPSGTQTGAQGTGNAVPAANQAAQAQSALAQAKNQSNFLGLNWGLGVGYAFGQGPRRVTATVVNNIVRVTSDVTNGPRVFLEAHYFPEKFTGKAGDFGWGPFATVEAGAAGTTGANGISGFGLGLMAGWRVMDNTSSGFNIGVGYLWEGNVQTLGDGIVANQPLPTGETQVRYKDQSVGAICVMFSWTFGSSVPSSKQAGN